jgi:hypothetical protein
MEPLFRGLKSPGIALVIPGLHNRRKILREDSMLELKSRSVLLSGADVESKREEMRAYFHRTYDIYEKLFEVLVSDEAFYQRPEPLRHPLIFYFGHTATFFVNKRPRPFRRV